MSFTVDISGGSKYKAILEKIVQYRKGVKAGVPSGATNGDTGMSIALYGIYNELGAEIHRGEKTIIIPSRPFMRETQAKRQDKWCHIIAGNLKNKDIQANSDKALGLCGEAMKGDIKESIQKGNWTPNSEATIKAKERKGKGEADHPLIDTGDLLKSIIYEVYGL